MEEGRGLRNRLMRFGRIHDHRSRAKGLEMRTTTSRGHGCLVHEYHQLVERPQKPLGVEKPLGRCQPQFCVAYGNYGGFFNCMPKFSIVLLYGWP